MKNAAAIVIFVCLACTLCACVKREEKPAPPQSVTAVRESTTRSDEQILRNIWSVVPEYKGSGTVSKISELNSSGKKTMYVKYTSANQEDILAYSESLNLPTDWKTPQYKGDSYCLEHKFGDSHSVRISYTPTEKEETDFEIRVTMYKPSK